MDKRTLRKFNELFLTSVCPLPRTKSVRSVNAGV